METGIALEAMSLQILSRKFCARSCVAFLISPVTSLCRAILLRARSLNASVADKTSAYAVVIDSSLLPLPQPHPGSLDDAAHLR